MRRFLADNRRWLLTLALLFVAFVVASIGLLHVVGPGLPPREITDDQAYAVAFWSGLYAGLIAGVITSLFTGLFVGVALFILQRWSEQRARRQREYAALLADLYRTLATEAVTAASVEAVGYLSAGDVSPDAARALATWEKRHLGAAEEALFSDPVVYEERRLVRLYALLFHDAAQQLDAIRSRMTHDHLAAHDGDAAAAERLLDRYTLGCLECPLAGLSISEWEAQFVERSQLADAPATVARLRAAYEEMVAATPELAAALATYKETWTDYGNRLASFIITLRFYLERQAIHGQ
jgi:hypothetical protein